MQPDSLETSELDAWYMDQSEDDQRLPHRYLLCELHQRRVAAGTTRSQLAVSLTSYVPYAD